MGSERSAARRRRVSFSAVRIQAQKSETSLPVLSAALLAVLNKPPNYFFCSAEVVKKTPCCRARYPGPDCKFIIFYLILASLNTTCLRTTGSNFLSSSLPVLVRGFFFVT